jgi:hypothetical protein
LARARSLHEVQHALAEGHDQEIINRRMTSDSLKLSPMISLPEEHGDASRIFVL